MSMLCTTSCVIKGTLVLELQNSEVTQHLFLMDVGFITTF